MARSRPQQSLADYVAIAISPALIMLLVGSLVFFILEATYDGAFKGRVQWMLFWFVFATVLIARIGIEYGKSHAATYAGALSIACGLFAFRFLEEYVVGTIILLGVIWWCVNKLTWDCTYIDDNTDASGEGLLQKTGIDTPSPEEIEQPVVETTRQRRRRLRREELLAGDSPTEASAENDTEKDDAKRKEKQHSPGVWVVYFSLFALPLFGVGQAFLPHDNPASRRAGFLYLTVYVAAALCLLLTTSFLGLRRYLRQRRITMPASITSGWLITGLLMILVVMGVALLIPRPDAETSVTALLDKFAKEQKASDYAAAADDAGEGEGRAAGEHRENEGPPGEKQGEKGAAADSDDPGKKEGGEKKGDQQGGDQQDKDSKSAGEKGEKGDPAEKNQQQQGDQQQNAEKQDENKKDGKLADNKQPEEGEKEAGKGNQAAKQSSSPPSSPPSSPLSSMATWVKWLIYLILGCLVLYGVIRNWSSIVAGGRDMLKSLADFWRNLFAGKKKSRSELDDENDALAEDFDRHKKFHDYANPFLTGEAHRMRPDALVIYSEQALRAFGYELGISREEELTAIEFGREVELRCRELGAPIQFLTMAYSRILYSSRPPVSFDIKPLENLWTGMTQFAQTGRVVEPVG